MDSLPGLISALGDLRHALSGLPTAMLVVLLVLSLFGAQLVNRLSDRDTLFHLAFSLSALFLGALGGNLLLAGVRLPVANELVLTAMLALAGMTVTALALLATYRRAGF